MVATVRGGFDVFSGTIVIDHKNPSASSAEVEIDTASISTGNEQRDEHLRERRLPRRRELPEDHLPSTSAEEVDADTYKLVGDLTIKDKTPPGHAGAGLPGLLAATRSATPAPGSRARPPSTARTGA